MSDNQKIRDEFKRIGYTILTLATKPSECTQDNLDDIYEDLGKLYDMIRKRERHGKKPS